MRSAFGVEHGEVSKALPKGLATAGKGNLGFGRPTAAPWAKQGAKKAKPEKLRYSASRTSRINPRG
jgi:hypothetical protein